MSTIVGNYNKYTSLVYTPGSAYNQQGEAFPMPSDGTLRRLGAWLSTSVGNAVRLVAWNGSTGAVLGYSAAFYPPNQIVTRYEMDITGIAVTAGQSVRFGWCWAAAGEFITFPIATGGTFQSDNNSGSSVPTAMSSPATVNYHLNAYGYLDVPAAPSKPTTESYGVVASATPTVRVNVTTPDSSSITSVSIVVTGTSPAHGPATKVIAGGPWASGSWVSYTLAPADLGWTPAVGDTLTYHGIAGNAGGSTTGDESTTLTINSVSAPTITSPAAGPVIAEPYLLSAKVGASVAWTFNDPQSEAQSAYQVCLYADNAGAQGALLAGADTGKVASVSARSAGIVPTAGLTNKAYFWAGVTTWDVHDAVSPETVVRTRMAWGRFDGRIDLAATPTVWQAPAIGSTTPANSSVAMEYGSTATATYPPASWAPFANVALARYLHFRAWLFGWGSATPSSPTLDSITITYTSAANVAPDNWDIATNTAGQGSLDSSVSKYGDRSVKIACTGANALKYAFQTIAVKPYTDYILSADILVSKAGGTVEAYVDLFDGTNSLVATSKVTATNEDFVRQVSAVYANQGATSLQLRLCVLDGTGASGSAAWFDAIACHPGQVAVAYSPSSGGRAAAFDAGGATLDGSRGAILRYRGSTGGQYDVVEGGPQGFLFGGKEIKGNNTGLYLDGALLTAAGKSLLDDADAAAQRTTLGISRGGQEMDEVGSLTDVTVTATTEATAQVIITGNSITYAAGDAVTVEGMGPALAAGAGDIRVIVWDDTAGAIVTCIAYSSVASQSVPWYGQVRVSPGAGAHVYSLRAYVSAGTGHVYNSTSAIPHNSGAKLRITRIS